MRLLGAAVFAVLVGAAVAFDCLPDDDNEVRFDRHDFVYTVLLTRQITAGPENPNPTFDLTEFIMWEVIIKGIMKQSEDLSRKEFIESRTVVFTPPDNISSYVNLKPGNYYVIGGFVDSSGEKHFESCDTHTKLAETALLPCPKGCAKWNDRCNLYTCSRDGDVLSVDESDCPQYGSALCESTKFVDEEPSFEENLQGITCPEDSLQSCPRWCNGKCVYVPQKQTECSSLRCLRPRKTFFCDIFSYWTAFEQRKCLKKGRNYRNHSCLREDCCTEAKSRKQRYCNASPECQCVKRKNVLTEVGH